MKKIAFIKNGVVEVALNTDESLADAFLNADLVIDVTENSAVEKDWTYNGTTFSAPVINNVESTDIHAPGEPAN
jgi:hypothetical protein